MSNSNSSTLLTRDEAAAYLHIAPKTLANWASTGKVLIPYHKIGKRVLYKLSDLELYLDSVKMLHTSLKAY
jgi:excisionase family DNA binding protein